MLADRRAGRGIESWAAFALALLAALAVPGAELEASALFRVEKKRT